MSSRCHGFVTAPSPCYACRDGARLLLRPLRAAAARRPPVPDGQVRATARAGDRRGRGRARRPRRGTGCALGGADPGPHARLRRRRRRRHAARGDDPPHRLPVVAGDGRAVAALGRRHHRRGPDGAGRGRGRQPRRRHPSCLRRSRRGLLRVQRRGGRHPRRAARGPVPAGRGGGLRRAPGQRHRRHLPRRSQRLHVLAARRQELPVPQGDQRPRRRAARRRRR